MKIFEINNLKSRLLKGDVIDLSNDEDMISLFYKETLGGSKEFIIELNSKIVGMNKRFRTFRDKVWLLVENKDFKFDEEANEDSDPINDALNNIPKLGTKEFNDMCSEMFGGGKVNFTKI